MKEARRFEFIKFDTRTKYSEFYKSIIFIEFTNLLNPFILANVPITIKECLHKCLNLKLRMQRLELSMYIVDISIYFNPPPPILTPPHNLIVSNHANLISISVEDDAGEIGPYGGPDTEPRQED